MHKNIYLKLQQYIVESAQAQKYQEELSKKDSEILLLQAANKALEVLLYRVYI